MTACRTLDRTRPDPSSHQSRHRRRPYRPLSSQKHGLYRDRAPAWIVTVSPIQHFSHTFRHRAAYTRAATATSSMAMPSDLNSVTSCGVLAAGVAADDHLAQLADVGPVQRALLQRLLRSRRPPGGPGPCCPPRSTSQRRTATASSSALPRKLEPMALMCVPSAIQWPLQHRLAAARRRDDDVLVLGRHLRPRHRHRPRSGTARSSRRRTAGGAPRWGCRPGPGGRVRTLQTACNCVRACLPLPNRPTSVASGRAMYLRGHAAGRPGAHLAEIVGLHQRTAALRSCRRTATRGTCVGPLRLVA